MNDPSITELGGAIAGTTTPIRPPTRRITDHVSATSAPTSMQGVIAARFQVAGIAIMDVETTDDGTLTFRSLAPVGVLKAAVPAQYTIEPNNMGGSGTEFWKITDKGAQTA